MKKDTKKEWREKHPMKAAYQTLKYNARRRGKEFDLTFEQFEKFAIETDYFIKKGKSKKSYHIDRIDETKGYSIDNIQALENSKNIKKYLKFKQRNPDNSIEFEVTNTRNITVNAPF